MAVTWNRQRPLKRPLPCPVQPALPTVVRAARLKHLPSPALPVPLTALVGTPPRRRGIPPRLLTQPEWTK